MDLEYFILFFYMKENGYKEKKMGKEKKYIQMELYMKDNIKMDRKMDKDN